MFNFKMKQCKEETVSIIGRGKETRWKKLDVKLPVLHFMVLNLESRVLYNIIIARVKGRWSDGMYL